MSSYTTKEITREEAEEMVSAVRAKKDRSVKALSDKELDSELHEYVYSEEYPNEVGVLYNYIIKEV